MCIRDRDSKKPIGNGIITCLNKKQAFGLTTPLFTNSSGEKMGKTNKGAIWLDEKLLSSESYWQFWRNTDDKDIIKFLKLFTFLDLKEIDKLPDKLSLIISFSEEDYKKAEKIIKFDSLGILIKDKN